jgi:hypothetical protein
MARIESKVLEEYKARGAFYEDAQLVLGNVQVHIAVVRDDMVTPARGTDPPQRVEGLIRWYGSMITPLRPALAIGTYRLLFTNGRESHIHIKSSGFDFEGDGPPPPRPSPSITA